jgi:signal transduction histidine kinase
VKCWKIGHEGALKQTVKKMSKSTIEPNDNSSLLIRWMRWYSRVILLIAIFFFIVYAWRQSPASLVIASAMAFVYFPLTLYGSHKARQQRPNPALFSIAFVCWTLALIVSGRGTIALPVTLPLAMLPMIISLPYISSRGLIGLAFGTLLVCMTATTLTLFDPILPSSLDERTLAVIMVPINSLALGLAIFGLWHVGSRLRKVLSETESINKALAASERSLEQKIKDRTADLENAFAEISDIENIAMAVNVTLELDDVITAMRKALQRVFHFDNISVFLLDKDRHSLAVHRVAGIELDPEKHGDVLQNGLSLTDKSNLIVATLLRRKTLLIPEIKEDQYPAMSASDRTLFDINPVKSILVCPLEIEDKSIGVVSFGRLQETMHLDPEEIDRIQRYVTPLATVIRNARLFDESRDARAEAIHSSQAKSQFLANMSHELRTPLNAIIGYCEMIMEDVEDDGHDQYLDDLQKIHASGLFLLELIGSVLELTKIEAGKLEVSLSRFNVDKLIDDVISTSQPLMKNSNNELLVSDHEALGQMCSDMTKVRQVLLNLLSNSAKFTDNGNVQLRASREFRDGRDWFTFSVIDNGIGMSPEQLEHAFEAFTQADESTSRKYGGTGLGLTITREFCELLGGEIKVKSEKDNGSVFTVILPAEPPEPPEPTNKLRNL